MLCRSSFQANIWKTKAASTEHCQQCTWPPNLASCCQICLSSMRYNGSAEEKTKCPEMWRWVVVFSAWGCYKQPCTHMLYFVARGDSCTEQPLNSAWCELTETSRKSNWLLASDSNSHSWSADITSSYIHLFIEVWCYIAKHCMAHAFVGVMFAAGRAAALCHKQGLSETFLFFFFFFFAMESLGFHCAASGEQSHKSHLSKVYSLGKQTKVKKYYNNVCCAYLTGSGGKSR